MTEVIDTKSKEQETLMHGVREQGRCFWNWDRNPEKRSPASQSALLAPVAMTYMCDFLVAQTVKRLSTMRETWVQALGRADPLETEVTIHSRTIAGKSHGQRSLVGYSLWGRKESDTTEQLHFHLSLSLQIR